MTVKVSLDMPRRASKRNRHVTAQTQISRCMLPSGPELVLRVVAEEFQFAAGGARTAGDGRQSVSL